MMKKISFGLLILLIFSMQIYAQKKVAANLDKIVAIVNSDVIIQSELDKRVKLMGLTKESKDSDVTAINASLRKQALDSLIDTLLQLQLAQHNNIQVSEAEIDKAINNIAKNNNLTLEQFSKVLQEHEGINFKEYRERIKEQMIISQVQQRFLNKNIEISKKEIKEILNHPPKYAIGPAQYHVHDILVALADDASTDEVEMAEKTVEEISAKLKQKIAIEKIIQEQNAAGQQVQSIDLEWRTIDQLPPLFSKEVSKMKAGQISSPIKAPNGFHFIKLLELQSAKKLTEEQAKEIVFHNKLEKQLKPWLKELRDAAYIKIMD
jgi:peptidyl-prolyl cis-trans isomerase SurA